MFTLSIELIVYVCFVLQDISDLLCLRSKGKVPNAHPDGQTNADRGIKTEETIHWRHFSPYCLQHPHEASQSFAESQSACLSHSCCFHGDSIDLQCIMNIAS